MVTIMQIDYYVICNRFFIKMLSFIMSVILSTLQHGKYIKLTWFYQAVESQDFDVEMTGLGHQVQKQTPKTQRLQFLCQEISCKNTKIKQIYFIINHFCTVFVNATSNKIAHGTSLFQWTSDNLNSHRN